MPNVGKPSKGCKNCRDRKIKCDQKRPSCSQCSRAHKECYGYRDPLTLMFKDENEVVARKAKNRYQELSKQEAHKLTSRKEAQSYDQGFSNSSSPSSTSSTLSTSTSLTSACDQQAVVKWNSPTRVTLGWQIAPAIEDRAIGFFLASYIITPTLIPRGQFDFLPEMLSGPNTEVILQKSAMAASLAALANATKCPQMMKIAQREYVSALGLTNKALSMTQTAVKNSTLVSVILLGMYENFTHQNKDSLKAWEKHVRGACALISFRGKSIFNDTIGTRIFQFFYGTVLLVALENKSEIPAKITELWELGTTLNDYSVLGRQWTTKMIRFMRNSIVLAGDTTSDPISRIEIALKLDKELDDLRNLMPNIWKYETMYIEKPADHVYGNSYHIYLDPWLVQIWNNLRIACLILHTTIRTELIKGLERCSPFFQKDEAQSQIKTSELIIHTTSANICASAPQITGQIPFPDIPATKPSVTTWCRDLFDPQDPEFKLHPPGTFWNPLRPTGLHNLIWPVFAIGENSVCPDDLRQWAIDQLHFVALKIGTRQAIILANELKELQNLGSVREFDDDLDDLHKLRWLSDKGFGRI